jgi:choline dehydrogenase
MRSGVAPQSHLPVRRSVHTYCHYAGTCRMGTDEHAVVDAELRVRGVRGAACGRRLGDAVPGQRQHQRHAIWIAERAAHLLRAQASGQA